MNLQQVLNEQVKRRGDILDMDKFVIDLVAKYPKGNFSILDDQGQKRFVADADFWPWRDELLAQIEQDIDDISKLMEIESTERFN
ncbi:hypothetical protein [Kocuria sp. HSID16901]|jgi:hypothetical protein|uniref:hypothetical protein n=1 Tax=Kocuria sp. HSID16901 TaxID=2419505 RepID=UPI000F862231|nr:hypothetical protein [Kocuria sp. HSID16901]RUQ19580.1 hypothetical protein D8M21_11230 [Kocuria sp. HSID16901]